MKRGRGKNIKIKRKAYFESKYLRVFTSTGCGLMSEALISCPAADLENSLTMNRACAMFVLWPFSLIAISNGWINLSLCRLLERKTKNKKGRRKKVTLSIFFFRVYTYNKNNMKKKKNKVIHEWHDFPLITCLTSIKATYSRISALGHIPMHFPTRYFDPFSLVLFIFCKDFFFFYMKWYAIFGFVCNHICITKNW